jgi:hypothetical protein
LSHQWCAAPPHFGPHPLASGHTSTQRRKERKGREEKPGQEKARVIFLYFGVEWRGGKFFVWCIGRSAILNLLLDFPSRPLRSLRLCVEM